MHSILTSSFLLRAGIVCVVLSSATVAAQSGSILQRLDGGGAKFGSYLANIGDIDADGFEDFAVQTRDALVYGSGFYWEGAGIIGFYSGSSGDLIRASNGMSRNMHWGGAACGVGDFDGDGIGDYAVSSIHLSGNGKLGNGGVFVYSGATGLILHEVYGRLDYSHLGGFLSSAGDLNGDGVHEIFVGEEDYRAGGVDNLGSVTVFDLKFGSRLWTVNGTELHGHVGLHGSAIDDINGDGHADLVTNDPLGFARIYSGIDGVLLLIVPEPSLNADLAGATDLGDINNDGVPDFIGVDEGFAALDKAWVLSGADGSVLRDLSPPSHVLSPRISIVGIEDFDGDGIPDYGRGLYHPYSPSNFASVTVFSGATGAVLWDVERIDSFGSDLATLQDRNGDGLREILVGDIRFDGPFQDSGAVFVISHQDPAPPILSLTGSCAAGFGITLEGVSAGEPVGLAYGPAGTFTIPVGPCAGTILDIQGPTLAGIWATGTLGDLSILTPPIGGACGMTLQAVDLYSCLPSNTVILQ